MNIKLKLNNFYNKVVSDVNKDVIDNYTIEIAKEYNNTISQHPKYKCRILFNITQLEDLKSDCFDYPEQNQIINNY